MNEEEYIKEIFKSNFFKINDKKIALYGLGKNTKVILNNFSDYNFVGILDGFETSGFFEGRKIISLEDTCKKGTEVIIIIARVNSTKIIAERISGFCQKNNIRLYDIYGNDLLVSHKNAGVFHQYFSVSADKLKEEILKHDVISFDVFDTLLMRKTLFPKDIFALIERKSGLCGFYHTRVEAERELYIGGNPKLSDIYRLIGIKLQIPADLVDKYMQMELTMEQKVLLPRDSMVDMLHFAIEHGKKVYLISDMYLSETEITGILKNNHITGYSKLLVSSEYNTTKSEELFEILKQQAKGISYLHIGDNPDADDIFARMKGIDTFPIRSALDMLEISSCWQLLKKVKTLDERLMLGLFLAKAFNSPFALCGTMGRPVIDSNKKLGYYFIAPLLVSFLFWVVDETREKYDRILWGARDGYLFNKMYRSLVKYFPKIHFPRSDYFLISRMAAVIAGLKDEGDINYAANIAFSGTPDELLSKRFFLTKSEIMTINAGESLVDYIMRHKVPILARAAEFRRRYLLYMESFKLGLGEKIAFFDFVSSGTCQMSLNTILGQETTGFYFVHHIESYEKKEKLRVKSFVERGPLYQFNSYLSTNYELIENIIVSNKPTLSHFDEMGKPVYAVYEPNKVELEYISVIQDAILKYLQDFLEISDSLEVKINSKFTDYFYSMVKRENSEVKDSALPHATFYDDFMNRDFVLKNTLG